MFFRIYINIQLPDKQIIFVNLNIYVSLLLFHKRYAIEKTTYFAYEMSLQELQKEINFTSTIARKFNFANMNTLIIP